MRDDVKNIKVALAGCGTVGGGVAEIVVQRGAALAERTGLRFELVRGLVSSLKKPRHDAIAPAILTDDVEAFCAADADLVVEVMGGTGTAREVVLAALRRGIPVVTANKALLAEHGAEIYAAARAGGTGIAFEASCAGGLPIVGALLRGLQANRIDAISGIFNSTCNFVLTQMLDVGMSFDNAVKEAQRAGYAEADPTLDVDGSDTAHKLTVLASLAFGHQLDFANVQQIGIEKVQLLDLQIAEEIGYACKLLGVGTRGSDGRVALEVRPTLVPHTNPFALMRGTSSAVSVTGDAVGETFYAGAGAGSLPTASAVVADMIEVASGATLATFNQLRTYADLAPGAEYVDPDNVENPCYVRFTIDAEGASPAAIRQAWELLPIRIDAFHNLAEHRSVVVITEPLAPHRLRAALGTVAGTISLTAQPVVLQVLAD